MILPSHYESYPQIYYRKASHLLLPMIIKSISSDEDKIENSSRINETLKLPSIESNIMHSCRSSRKPNMVSVFDSLKFLVREQHCKEAEAKAAEPGRIKNITISKKSILDSAKGPKRYSKRIRTDSEGVQIERVLSRSHKKNIVEKLFKITQELGMAGADYQNYMKTERKSKCRDPYQTQRKTSFRIKTENFSLTIPLEETASNIQIDPEVEKDKQKSVINVLRYNLKQKPSFKEMVKVSEAKPREKQRKQVEFNSMNKSIRGWTKYGKLQQEIEY